MQLPDGPFDATQVEPDAPYEPIPPGDYPVMVTDTSLDPTSKGDGIMLKLELQVLDGHALAGRKLFDRMLLKHPSEKAVEIARRKLSAVCHATGVMKLNDSAELHGKSLLATVKVKPAQGEYGPSNEVSGYKPINGSQTSIAQPSPQQPTTAQPKPQPVAAGTGAAPWAR